MVYHIFLEMNLTYTTDELDLHRIGVATSVSLMAGCIQVGIILEQFM